MLDFNCYIVSLSSWLGSWFLALGGAALTFAGYLFDILVTYVIIAFRSSLNTLGILSAIDTGWTLFRDIANLLIIGLFTFIALAIILGLKDYGEKKLIARVLAVAILLNFSLLFTKIIIDVSNFTAFAIYRQMAGQQQSFDIAAAFLRPMKITSIWNDSGKVTADVAQTTKSGLQAFLFGLVGGMLLLGVAGVLFYGCFLIASRGVLLVMLMLMSAVAFASYLVPNFQSGKFGWNSWWKMLVNSAVFAPMLMALLWISLLIIQAAGNQVGSTNLGTIVGSSNPQADAAAGWTAIFVYVIGVGLLFGSFKLASQFAGTASAMSAATGALRGLRFAGAGVLAGGLAGAGRIGQNTIGRAALGKKEELEAEIKRLHSLRPSEMDASTKIAKLNAAQAALDKANKTAGRDFNLMNTALGKQFGRATGIGTLGQTATGGAAKSAKDRAAEAEKKLAATRPSKEVEKQMLENVIKEVDQDQRVRGADEERRQAEQQEAAIKTQKQTAEEQLKLAREQAAAQEQETREAGERQIEEARSHRKEEIEALQGAVEQGTKNIMLMAPGEPGRAQLQARIDENKAKAAAIISERNDRITKATTASNESLAAIKSQFDELVQERTKAVEEFDRKLAEAGDNVKQATTRHTNIREAVITEKKQEVKDHIDTVQMGMAMNATHHDEYAAKELVKMVNKKQKTDRLKDLFGDTAEKTEAADAETQKH